MKKFTKILAVALSPIVVYGFFYFTQVRTNNVRAFGELAVDLGVPSGQPIFTVSNFLPGDCEVRSVEVANGGNSSAQVTVRSKDEIDHDKLSKVIDITITESASTLYSKTLKKFFSNSDGTNGIFLSSLSAGDSTTYEFEVCFDSSAENKYQNTEIIFDLVFGEIGSEFDLPAECAHLEGIITEVIYGTDEDDRIFGSPASELILGYDGNDRIDGKSGHDCIVGGAGNDDLDGGRNNDVILGGEGDDDIEGGAQHDILYGGAGNDKMDGSSGKDTLYGGTGDDELDGGPRSDTLYGGAGFDMLDGSTSNDVCSEGEDYDSCEVVL